MTRFVMPPAGFVAVAAQLGGEPARRFAQALAVAGLYAAFASLTVRRALHGGRVAVCLAIAVFSLVGFLSLLPIFVVAFVLALVGLPAAALMPQRIDPGIEESELVVTHDGEPS